MADINFYFENVEKPKCFSSDVIKKWLEVIAMHYSRINSKLSFIFCDDEYILDVNRKFLQHDYYTDVITFDYCRNNNLSGDIFISLDTVKSNSERFSTSFDEEFHRVVCHSILHLIGFKDKTPEHSAEMRRNEDICLALFRQLF